MTLDELQARELLTIFRSVQPEEERVLNAYLLGVLQTVQALKNHMDPFSISCEDESSMHPLKN